MRKVLTQLQRVKDKKPVLNQYMEILLKHGAVRSEKVWEETKSGKKIHRQKFNYYLTEKGNNMLNLII